MHSSIRFSPRALAFRLFASSAVSSCVSADVYVCDTNLDCIASDGTMGICEVQRSCSFPDTSCPTTQRRYAERARADLAAQCVAPPSSSCIAALSGGDKHFCLLRRDGGAACWGANEFGQLGDGTTQDAPEPVTVQPPDSVLFAAIYAGEESTCALSNAGDVYCWGSNREGETGTALSFVPDSQGNDQPASDPQGSTTPKKVDHVLAPDVSGHLRQAPSPHFIGLGVGGKHACALSDAGDVYCWGENNRGQCGAPLDQPVVLVPTAVPGLTAKVRAIAPGDEFTLALTQDGSVLAWGDNVYGEFGDGSTVDESPTPVEVKITAVGQIAAGASHACAHKADGSVWCWGYGASGSLGIGVSDDKRLPQHVTSAAAVFTSGLSFHTCAIDIQEQLYCWGQNDTGAIGAGTIGQGKLTGVMEPIESALTTVTMVATSNTATCAVTTDQVLWCWGDNDRGQLGTRAVASPSISALPVRSAFACP